MALQTLNTIKKWFKTGLKPTQAQFWDTWDSFRHKYDKVPVKDIDGIDELLLSKADKTVLDNHLADKNAHAPQVNTDWNSESGFSQLLNKPEFRTINGETIVGTGDIAIKEGGFQDLDQTLLNGNTSETPIIVTKDYGGGAIATNTISSNSTIMTARNNPNDSVMLVLSPSGLNFSGSLTGQRTSLGISSLGVNSDDYDTDPGSAYFEFDKIQRHFRNENKNINLMFPKKNGTFTIATLDDVIDENNITLQKVLENGSTGIVPDGVKIGHNANDDSTWSTINLKEGDGIDIYSNNVLNVEAKNFYINTTNEGGFISGGDPDLESNPFRINSQHTGMSIGGGTKGIEIEGQGGSVKLSGTDNGNGGVQITSRLGIGKVKNIETDNIEINTGTAKLLYNGTEVATMDRLDGKINKIEKGIANGLATLDNDGKIPNSQIPALAISETFVINSQADMLALSQSEQGDVAVRTDLSKCFILRASPPSTLENWQELLTPSDSVQSVNGQVGNVNLTTAEIQESTNKNYQTDNQKLFNDATSSIQNQLNGKQANLGFTPEPAFSKNTSFNKNFGTVTGTVAEGNDARILNGQTAFGWGDHAGAGYALSNGSNASGTWAINITGRASIATNSDNATRWGGVSGEFTAGDQSSNLGAVIGRGTDGNAYTFNATAVKTFLGLSSAITGTGTGNRLPKFTGTGTVLVDSNVSDNGSNVTIMSPLQLDSAGGGNLSFRNSGTPFGLFATSRNIQGSGSETDLNAYVYGENPFGIWTNGVKRVIVAGDGNVGIGSAPSTNLSVFKTSGVGTVINWGNVGGGAYGGIGFDGNGSYLTNFAGQSALYIYGNSSIVGVTNAVLRNYTTAGTNTAPVYEDVLKYGTNGNARAIIQGYNNYNSSNGTGFRFITRSVSDVDIIALDISPSGTVTAPNFIGNLNGNATSTTNWQGLPRTAGNIATAGYVMTMNNDGSNAGYTTPAQLSTTMGLNNGSTLNNNISGNAGTANSATNWGGFPANFNAVTGSLDYIAVRDVTNGIMTLATSEVIRNWLGLGSNAYTSTAYLPLTGGILTGNFSAPNIGTSNLTIQTADPYLQFVNTSGTRLGYIQHTANVLALVSDSGTISLSNNTTVLGTITASGGFFNSDEKLKDIIKRDGNVAYFKWKDGRDDKTHIGYIAQEVQKTNPDQVIKGEDGILSVNYIEILVQEIQSLKKEIKVLKGGRHGVC